MDNITYINKTLAYLELIYILYEYLFEESYEDYIFSLTTYSLNFSKVYIFLFFLFGSIALTLFLKRKTFLLNKILSSVITIMIMYYFVFYPIYSAYTVKKFENAAEKIFNVLKEREIQNLPNVQLISEMSMNNFTNDEAEISRDYISIEYLTGQKKIKDPVFILRVHVPGFSRNLIAMNYDRKFKIDE